MVSSSSTGAGHGTRASRRRLQPSSSTAPPASHGRRWPTSSAPPGTAPAPAASGHGRVPTRSTRRASVTTKRQRIGQGGGGAHRPTPPCATDAASQGRARVEGRRTAVRRFGTRSGAAPLSRSQQPALGLVELQEAGDWQAPTMPAHYARHQLAARGAVAKAPLPGGRVGAAAGMARCESRTTTLRRVHNPPTLSDPERAASMEARRALFAVD